MKLCVSNKLPKLIKWLHQPLQCILLMNASGWFDKRAASSSTVQVFRTSQQCSFMIMYVEIPMLQCTKNGRYCRLGLSKMVQKQSGYCLSSVPLTTKSSINVLESLIWWRRPEWGMTKMMWCIQGPYVLLLVWFCSWPDNKNSTISYEQRLSCCTAAVYGIYLQHSIHPSNQQKCLSVCDKTAGIVKKLLPPTN